MIDPRESILFLDRWTASNPSLKHSIASVDPDALAAEYRAIWANAPCRLTSYFSGRDGTTQGRHPDTPRIQWEPRYAMALWNLECCWPRLDGGWHRFLDYQMPLKAIRANRGIGKIDLLGVTDRGRLIVVELKCPRRNRGQSPMHAWMEGLRYAAIVEANLGVLAREARNRFGCKIAAEAPPIVQVLGPRSWWRDWLDSGLKRRAAGDWNLAFARLASAVEARIGVSVECMAIHTNIGEVVDGLCKSRPSFDCPPTLYLVHLDRNPHAFEALRPINRFA